jgi:hypothetical protein
MVWSIWVGFKSVLSFDCDKRNSLREKNKAKLLQLAELVLPVLGVSIVIGVPLYRRMVYDGKSHLEMEPPFQETPIYHLSSPILTYKPRHHW